MEVSFAMIKNIFKITVLDIEPNSLAHSFYLIHNSSVLFLEYPLVQFLDLAKLIYVLYI